MFLRSLATVAVLAAALTAGASVEARRPPALTIDQQLAFLETARVVAAKPIGKGVTGALRLTLTDGVLTHDASFQSVDKQAQFHEVRQGKRFAGELLFVDSFRYNVAAWELARLLGLDEMTPPTVERYYRGEPGAFSWWVDDVLMDEGERERTNTQPASVESINVGRQRQRMQVFAELVRDTDRNKGNVLYTKDWRPVMLEIDALMKRRDLIVARFDRLVAQRGASAVLF